MKTIKTMGANGKHIFITTLVLEGFRIENRAYNRQRSIDLCREEANRLTLEINR